MRVPSKIILTAAILLPVIAGGQTDATDKKLTAREMFLAARDEAQSANSRTSKPKAAATSPRAPKPKLAEAPNSPPDRLKPATEEASGAATRETVGTNHPKAPAQDAPGDSESRSGLVEASYSPAARPLGIRYKIIKKMAGERMEVAPDTVFHSGDRIQLGVEVSEAGYLYIVTQGSSGTWELLFPSAKIEHGDNHVESGRTYSVPEGYVFTMVGKPGIEKLFVVFSRQPVSDLDRLIYSLQGGERAPASAPEKKKPETSPMLFASLSPIDDSVVSQLRNVYARDLIIEKVDEKADASHPDKKQDVSVYVVNPKGGTDSRVVADVSLIHE